MKKILAILMLFVFGTAQAVFAGGAVMPDKAMDEISAGDWVVLNDNTPDAQVVDVWYTTNDIKLQNESQTELKAVNNANAVDSAIAVQTNIARVAADKEPTVNVGVSGTNRADLLNYNPSDSGSEYSKTSKSDVFVENSIHTESVDCASNKSHSESAASSDGCNLDVNITYDAQSQSQSQSDCEDKSGGCESQSQSQSMEDLDVVIVGSSLATTSETEECAETKTFKSIEACQKTTDSSKIESEETGSDFRKNLSENNHLSLEDTSQKLLMAVSNLNSVGSAAAVQTNIASNVGVQGTISHLNEAKAVNGM